MKHLAPPELRKRIWGSLAAAAMGDALGAPTEQMSFEQILETFGGLVDRFYAPDESRPFSHGRKAGEVTDDSSQMIELCKAFLEAGTDRITVKHVVDALLRWAEDPEMFTRFAGATTSAASAVAAGIAQALTPGANVYSVVQACLFGARLGEGRGRELGRTTPGPSVEARMEIAVELGLKAKNIEDACRLIGSYVGSGLHSAEAVPAAIGLFIAAKGDPFKTVVGAACIGDDTDTIATIAGSLAGALGGIDQIPKSLYDQLEELNHLGLEGLAEQLCDLALRLHPEINR